MKEGKVMRTQAFHPLKKIQILCYRYSKVSRKYSPLLWLRTGCRRCASCSAARSGLRAARERRLGDMSTLSMPPLPARAITSWRPPLHSAGALAPCVYPEAHGPHCALTLVVIPPETSIICWLLNCVCFSILI